MRQDVPNQVGGKIIIRHACTRDVPSRWVNISVALFRIHHTRSRRSSQGFSRRIDMYSNTSILLTYLISPRACSNLFSFQKMQMTQASTPSVSAKRGVEYTLHVAATQAI